jgi:hypothetical protein
MMSSPEEFKSSEPTVNYVPMIVSDIKSGKSKAAIISQLKSSGADPIQAREQVDKVFSELNAALESQRITTNSLVMAILAAGAAAILGGVVWGIIVLVSGYEIGFMATGIGVLTGYAVAKLTRARGVPMQIIAVVAALIGILIGKYVTFYGILRELLTTEYGAEVAKQVSILSSDVFTFFLENFTEFLSVYDVLWVVLAIIAAWRIPKGLNIKRPPEF